MDNYCPLWIKSDYSILSSLIKIDDLIKTLSLNNIKVAAICDDNLYGTMEFYSKCIKNDIKPIIGLQINLEYTVLLYAKNYHGYQNLCNINKLKNENKLNEENLHDYLDDLLIVLPYEYKIYKDKFFDYENYLFIGFYNKEQMDKIDGNKVYIKKVLSLNKNDEKYLKYLYQMKEEDYNEQDVTLDESIDITFKKTTIYFSNLIDLKIEKQNDLLPIYDVDNPNDYLTKLCIVGLKKRLNNNVSKNYIDRLKYELNIINNMGFCNYFLVVWDYVKYAKKNNIMTNTRGSAASSLVSYCLGISDVDPIKYDLLFERFLNPSRVTMPDIDVDFDAQKRDDVIKYVTEKYGNDKVSGIITFSNLLAKQVIRDVARLFDISLYKVDDLVKKFEDKKDLKYQLTIPSVKKVLQNDVDLKKVYDIAMHLEGLKRHTSIHAAGIIISSKNLKDYVPLHLNDDGSYLCGYTMNYIENLGLLKMDFLGLKNLTMINNIMKNITNINYNEIPLDDKKTYDLFSKGALDEVFQFESNGMKKFIMELKPDNINDLIAAVALFRPGPIDNIPVYIKRKQGKEKVEYITDDLKDILKDTYGIIIYQEQIMQIARKVAGFSFADADNLRRAMSKKKEDLLLSYKERFISGGLKNGYDENTLNDIYNLILKFANYGFNKAHSVCYAIMGYKIAYLKVHYPLYFMTEALNNCLGAINKTNNCIDECKLLGIKVIKPSINTASYEYKINDEKIEYSLAMIKGIGTLICRQIVNERLENGLYTSYLDAVKRLYKLGRKIIETLILSGCFDEFKISRKTMIENLDEAFNYAELAIDLDDSLIIEPVIKEYDEYSSQDLTNDELELYGMYLSNHPTNMYINDKSITTNKLNDYFDKNINIVLYFERKKQVDTKKGDKMMFITASDSYGKIDLVMFPKVYERFFDIKVPGIYSVYGKVEKRLSNMQIVITDVKNVD